MYNNEEFTPKIIFPISADPMHSGHIKIKELAEEKLGEKVNLLVCRNYNKSVGLFSIEERLKIANLYLPSEKIFVEEKKEIIKNYLENAKIIVKGFRSFSEYESFLALSEVYDISQDDFKNKILYVHIIEDSCSSLKIKTAIKNNSHKEIEKFILPEVISLIEKKLLSTISQQDLNTCIENLM